MGDQLMTATRTTFDVMEELRGLHITTPRDAEFQQHLSRLLKQDVGGKAIAEAVKFGATKETRGIMVVDEPGGGKSTLVHHGLHAHTALIRNGTAIRPFISATVPSPGTYKNMGTEILSRTDYQLVGRREAHSIWSLVRHRLELLGCIILWIDEAHDLFSSDRNLILRALKTLMQGDGAIIVILSGTMSLAEHVRSDSQVQRRFSTLVLPRVTVDHDIQRFVEVIATYAVKAGLGWNRDRLTVERLFHASRYVFGRCVETIYCAIEEALMSNAKTLTIDHFARAWALQEGCRADHNVFLANEWWAIYPDGHPELKRPSLRRGKRA